MIKPIKFRLLSVPTCVHHQGILRDTTVGSTYEGTLFEAGCKTHGIEGAPVPLQVTTVIFIDDQGDVVTAWPHKLNIEVLTDVVVPVKTTRKYTRVSSGNRQFDIKFKRKTVRTVQKLRETGGHGDIKRFLSLVGITNQHLHYWEKQMNTGLLKKRNAVSFSTKPNQMVRG